jgi:hypothetical protein
MRNSSKRPSRPRVTGKSAAQPFALVAIDEAATVITWEFRSSHGAHDEGGLMHAPWHSKLQRPRNS